MSAVRRWVRRFKDGELGQEDLSDKTRRGRPVTVSDQLHQDRVEELIREKQKETDVALGISKGEWDTLLVFLDSENFVPDGYRAFCLMK